MHRPRVSCWRRRTLRGDGPPKPDLDPETSLSSTPLPGDQEWCHRGRDPTSCPPARCTSVQLPWPTSKGVVGPANIWVTSVDQGVCTRIHFGYIGARHSHECSRAF